MEEVEEEGRPIRPVIGVVIATCLAVMSACSNEEGNPGVNRVAARTTPSESLNADRDQDGRRPVVKGDPIAVEILEGRIVFDDFEDVYVMRADGNGVRAVTQRPGAEFDGAWAPDGRSIVYRDSRRGINENDEIFIAHPDGTGRRNLTNHPANDWGPDWSPDGSTIVFNSDRDGGSMTGYLVRPDGTGLRRIDADVWVEYPSFSPDGTRIAFMGHEAGDYDVYVADLETGDVTRLTDSPGSDGWPVWSPEGSMIAFTSQRDDCLHAPVDAPCWVDRGGEPGEHSDIWIMNADGSSQRRVTPEFGQFATWSPDGDHLLISGASLYVIRPDGTGRTDVLPRGGGIPDWI